MARNSENSLQIRHECPQCGSPITLLEDDRMFSCAYCRVKLFLAGGDYFRYCILPADDVREEIRYVPYWRFKGLDYSVVPFEVTGRHVDQTVLALARQSFPTNLGFRPQVLTLRFVSPDVPGRFLPSTMSVDDAFTLAQTLSASLGGPDTSLHRSFIGNAASMIYAPVYEKDGTVHDAVLKTPLAACTPEVAQALAGPEARPDWRVEFLSTLCPECGWQLTGENGSAIFICGNCVSVWEMSGRALKRVEFIVKPGRDKGIFYIPFWRIAATATGVVLETYADFARAVNLPKAIQQDWEKQGLFFWLPAFKTRPDLFLRLATLLTVNQPQVVPNDERIWTGREDFAPITLGAHEAAQGLMPVLAKMAPKKLYEVMPETDLQLKSAALVLLPFRRSNEEFIEIDLNFSIPRLAVSGSGT